MLQRMRQMNKTLGYLAAAVMITVSSARAECPNGNCELAGRNNPGNSRYYQVTPCSVYPYTTKGAPLNREAVNSRCGNSVQVYPLSDGMRRDYYSRERGYGSSPSPYNYAPGSNYKLAEALDLCMNGDLDSKNINRRMDCLDTFDRALNDPAFADKHKKLIKLIEGYLNSYVPANGSLERPDVGMASEIMARNHRLDRDGCFKFPEERMARLREYFDGRSNVLCKPRNNVSETDASYILTDDDKNAVPGRSKVGSSGSYTQVDFFAPDGKPMAGNKDYKLSDDGKTVIGPDGETYTVDKDGKYITADGQPVIGDNGQFMGPKGPIDSNLDAQAVKDKKVKDALNDPKYKGLIEENKKLDEARGAEDKVVDADLTSAKYTKLANVAALSCDSTSCATKLASGNKTYKDLLADVKKILDNRNANVASRLDAICTAKCVSIADRTLEPDAIKTLAKYVRRRAPWPLTPKPAPEVRTKSVRPDVQAALFVIGGKDRTDNIGEEINLTAVDLRGADLSEANLQNVDLSFSNLSTTNLKNAVGLTKWDKINLIALDETTLIPPAVSAGYKVRKKPNILPLEVGSFKVISDDWIFWQTKMVQPRKN